MLPRLLAAAVLALLASSVLASTPPGSVPQIADEAGFFGPAQPANVRRSHIGARAVSRYITEVREYFGDTICNGTETGGAASIYNFALSDDATSAKAAFVAFLGSTSRYTFPDNLSVPASPSSQFVCGVNNQGYVQSVAARYFEATLETTRSDFFENFTSTALSNVSALQTQQQFFATDLFGGNSSCSRANFYYRTFVVLNQCRYVQNATNATQSTAYRTERSSNGLSAITYRFGRSTNCSIASTSSQTFTPLNTCLNNITANLDTVYSILTLPNLGSVAASNFPSPSVTPSTSLSPTASASPTASLSFGASRSPSISPSSSPSPSFGSSVSPSPSPSVGSNPGSNPGTSAASNVAGTVLLTLLVPALAALSL